jgi:hypothetical protein
MPSETKTPVLCYVDGNVAYFTTQPLEEANGDDWNDTPYEHNAGTPYRWSAESEHDKLKTPCEITSVYFIGPFQRPEDFCRRDSGGWCVDDINRGLVPWLITESHLPTNR